MRAVSPAPLRVLAVLLATGMCVPTVARSAQDDPLAVVESAADRGEVDEARAGLAAYLRESGPTGDPEARARLNYLRGRLAADPDSAELAYLRAAIDGEGRYARLARLRVGQLQLARGDHARAAEQFARLRADDPEGGLVPISWLWTARAEEAAGDVGAACAAWGEALERLPAADPARGEATAARSRCESGGKEPGEVETFTVQLGAFGTEEAAMRLRDGAAAGGVSVRVDRPSGGVHVYRVRSGRFGSRDDAERLAERFRAAGHEAIVVPEDP